MTGFRFTPDLGFERRCPVCADWWPITTEFWDKHWTTRCRACIRAWRRANQNARYATDPVYREVRLDAARLTAWKDRQNRPLVIAERNAAYYRANRRRILERQRIRYHSRKTAA